MDNDSRRRMVPLVANIARCKTHCWPLVCQSRKNCNGEAWTLSENPNLYEVSGTEPLRFGFHFYLNIRVASYFGERLRIEIASNSRATPLGRPGSLSLATWLAPPRSSLSPLIGNCDPEC